MKMSKFRAVANAERGTRDALMRATTVTVFICLLLSMSADGAVDSLNIPPNTGCVCPGDELTFTCTIIGIGNTIWRGSAFDCQSSSNQIILRHSQFAGEGTMGSCTSGSLRANSLGVENGNCYVSQLNATVQASFDGQSIGCYHNSVGTRLINESVLNVVSVANPSPPQNLNLVSISEEQVSFSWTALPPPCSLAEYTYIISSDCGVCPGSTNASTVTCTGFQPLTESNGAACTFTVNSRLCGITGDISAEALLRVPNVPSIENVIPSYLNDTKELKRLLISVSKNETEDTMNDISGVISTYNLSLTTSPSGSTVSISIDADSGSCDDNTCTYTVDVPQDVCTSSSNLSTALSARNRAGQGFPSDIVDTGCTNDFVRLDFNATTSIFTCTFPNDMDNSEKSCSIRLTRDGQELPTTVEGRSTNTTRKVVSLDLGDIADGVYSFIVSASSSVASIQVEGDISKGAAGRDNTVAIVVGVVAVVVGFSVLVVVALVVFKCHKTWKYKHVRLPRQDEEADDSVKVERTDVKAKLYLVNEDCKEGDAVMSIDKQEDEVLYYELTDEEEDVLDPKELLFLLKEETPSSKRGQSTRVQYSAKNGTSVDLLTQVSGHLQLFVFSKDVDSNTLHSKGLIGEGITRKAFEDKYRMFALNKDSGTRHLARDTFILCVQQTQGHETSHPLLQVPPGYFTVYTLGGTTATLGDLYKNKKITQYKTGGRTCLELGEKVRLEDTKNRDIVLMDKDKKLFTGPSARKLLEGKDLNKEYEHMRKFILGSFDEDHVLTAGTTVLCENLKGVRLRLRLLDVDEDNVRLSAFVRKKLGWFEKGKFFYEFTQPEDLLYCRKMIRALDGQLKQAKNQEQEMDASMEVFYSIPEAPGINVSRPETAGHRTNMFIHDPTQGSRCLKNGTRLLYICEGAI